MSWEIIRFEGIRLRRSPGVWVVAVLFAVVLAAGAAIPAFVLADPSAAIGAAFLLGPATDLLLPLVAIILTASSLAGLRADGRISLYLGLPITRSAVLAGILVSRILGTLAIAGMGLAAGIVAVGLLYGVPPVRPVVGFIVITSLAAASYAAIGVGVSATTNHPVRAFAILIGGVILAHSLWGPTLDGIHYALTGEVPGADPPRWIEALTLLSPLEAYTAVANGILPPSPHLEIALDGDGTAADPGPMVGGEIARIDLLLAVGVLIGWAVLAILLGWRRFERAEIG